MQTESVAYIENLNSIANIFLMNAMETEEIMTTHEMRKVVLHEARSACEHAFMAATIANNWLFDDSRCNPRGLKEAADMANMVLEQARDIMKRNY